MADQDERVAADDSATSSANVPATPSIPKRVWAWFNAQGLVAKFIVTIVTAVATALVVGIATRTVFDSSDPGPPSFSSPVTSKGDARDFVSFLQDHDNEIAYIDVQCGPASQVAQPDSGCSADVRPEFMADTPGQVESAAVIELFIRRTCPASDARGRCPGTFWAMFSVGPNDDQQVDNGSFGAGGLVAKGTFKVLVRGAVGSVPSNVELIELRAATDG